MKGLIVTAGGDRSLSVDMLSRQGVLRYKEKSVPRIMEIRFTSGLFAVNILHSIRMLLRLPTR